MLIAALALLAADVTYHKDVLPILKQHCIICHSDDNIGDPETSGGLSLSNPAKWLNLKKPLVVSHKLDASELYTRLITKDEKKRMPKDDEPLSAEKIAIIKQWIESGLPLGEEASEQPYRRRESGVETKPRSITIPFELNAPAEPFGAKTGGKLSLEAPLGPANPITAVAISPDGNLLVTGAFRRMAVWDLQTGELKRCITDAAGEISGLAFSPDGSQIWLAGGEPALHGEVRGYRTSDWSLISEIPVGNEVVTSFAVSPNGKHIATVGLDRMIRIFDAKTRKEVWAQRGHSDGIFSVVYSSDGKQLATAGKDKTIKIWDAEKGESTRTVTGARDEIYAMLFSKDGKELFSGGKEPQLRRISLGKGNRVNVVGGHGIAMMNLAWARDFSRFASAGADRTIRLWKSNGSSERNLSGAGDVLYSVALTPDGKRAAGACANGFVYLWDCQTGQMLARFFTGIPASDSNVDWLMVTTNGYFRCSSGLLERSHWMVGLEKVDGKKSPGTMNNANFIREILSGKQVSQSPFVAPAKPPEKKPAPKKNKKNKGS